MLAGTHPDLLVVNPDPTKVTRIITAEQAREVISALQLQRHSARRRFVVIDPADAMGEEAGNALLKTLEEPPDGTQFVLVTARAASLLQTVRSRSQRVRFGPVSRAALEAWLAARGVDPGMAELAQGSPGLALALADGGAEERRAVVAQLVELVGQPLARLFAFTDATAKGAEGAAGRGAAAVDALEELLRDVVLVACGRPADVRHRAHLERLRLWAQVLYPGGIARMERGIAAARDRMRLNVNGRVVLEALLSALNREFSAALR